MQRLFVAFTDFSDDSIT